MKKVKILFLLVFISTSAFGQEKELDATIKETEEFLINYINAECWWLAQYRPQSKKTYFMKKVSIEFEGKICKIKFKEENNVYTNYVLSLDNLGMVEVAKVDSDNVYFNRLEIKCFNSNKCIQRISKDDNEINVETLVSSVWVEALDGKLIIRIKNALTHLIKLNGGLKKEKF